MNTTQSNQPNTQLFTTWIKSASSDDLLTIGKVYGQRIVDMPLETRKQFVQGLPQRVFEGIPQHTNV